MCRAIAASLISMHVNCPIPVLMSSFYLTTEDAASAILQPFMQVLKNVINGMYVVLLTVLRGPQLARMYCRY